MEKRKDDPRYPLLVPKSYQDLQANYPIENVQSTCADCQVIITVKIFKLKLGNEIIRRYC